MKRSRIPGFCRKTNGRCGSQPGRCGFSKEEKLRTRLLLKNERHDPAGATGGWRKSFKASIADDRAGTQASVDETWQQCGHLHWRNSQVRHGDFTSRCMAALCPWLTIHSPQRVRMSDSG